MAFLQFSDKQYIKTIDTGESPQMGSFKLANNGELKYMRVLLYINGVSNLAGSEQIRVSVYGDSAFGSLLFSSDYSDLSDITGIGSTNWIGYLRVDFDRQNINKNITYYARVDTNNYTRNGDTFYIGLSYDFPYPISDNGEDLFYDHPLAMQIFTFS